MTEWIVKLNDNIKEKQTVLAERLTRCRDCEHHGKRTNMCSIWHAHTKPEGYCHRGKIYGKE